ncbi:Ig-like domain-containing protein [Brevibacillus sp. DP1.3A]|uniref:Ig-like domain-containing protein n=1 Tax=Brevibacillus sp. DP1.3A TaxID=2738867 RepID=UPI00156AA28C|nr:Ig-like domain-containing protein [Brevibacillus sp. DP1.3A]UED75543.1 Ig-like domain-containing protein [Brevibacillus sp. DP1.3A]
MNKKVVLSVLSTTLVASLAASAFAAPKDGIYIGGDIKKFYSTDVLFEMTPAAKTAYNNELKSMATNLNNIVFVDFKGNGASLQEMFDKGGKVALGEPLKKEDFVDLYKVVNKDGSSTATENARDKVDGTTPGELKVESVSAINLKQVEVKFSKEVDETSATNVNNYLENLVPIQDSAAKAEVQADGKTVVITYATVKPQQTKLSLTVKNVQDTKGNKVETVAKDVTFVDTTFPAVKGITVDGNKSITLEFSEPVKAPAALAFSSYKLNGSDLSAFGVTGANAEFVDNASGKNTKVKFNFGVALQAASYTLSVKGATIQDEANFFVNAVDVPFSIVSDTTGPVFVSAAAVNLNTVDITFDEAVALPALGDISVNGSALSAPAATIAYKPGTSDKKTVRITKANLVASGANLITIGKERVADLFGNKSATEFRFTVSGAVDTIKPEVKAITSVDDKTIKVAFNEAMGNSATNKANYTIKDATGATVGTINSVTPHATELYTYNLNLTTALPGGAYTVEVANAMDASNNVIVTVSKSINVTDTTAPLKPTGVVISQAEGIIKINFSEAMDRASITNKANYQVKIDGGTYEALPAEAVITPADDNKSVTIDLPNLPKYANLDGLNGDQVRVAQVKDVAGNFTKDIVDEVLLGQPTTLAPAFLRATATSSTSLVVEYDKPLVAVQANDFIYGTIAASTAVLQNTKVWNSDKTAQVDGSKVILTFAADTIDSAVAGTLKTEANADINTKDALGNIIPGSGNYTGTQLVDKYAPTYGDADVSALSATQIKITFSENLDGGYAALYKNDFTVLNGGSSVTVKSSSVSNKELTLTLDRALDLVQETVVTVKSTGLTLQDINGNILVPTADNLDGAKVNLGGVADKTAAINTANQKIASVPAATDITATTLAAAKTAVSEAEAAVAAAKAKGATDADFADLAKIDAAKAKIAELDAGAEKATLIATANEKIALVPAADTITAANLAVAKTAVSDAEAAVTAAKAKGGVDADFTGLAKIDAAKAKIAELDAAAEKAALIATANEKIALVPAAADIDAATKDAAQTAVDNAETAVTAAKAKGAVDADFTELAKIQAAKDKIATL